jgi:hypothetical protein
MRSWLAVAFALVTTSAHAQFYPCDDPQTPAIEPCTQCDDPKTPDIEFCCEAPLDEASCAACDDPLTVADECTGEIGGEDGYQVEPCSGGIACGPCPSCGSWDPFFGEEPFAATIADDVRYTPPPAVKLPGVDKVDISVTARSCSADPAGELGYTFLVTLDGGKRQTIVFVPRKRPFQGKVHPTISETTFVTSKGWGLTFSYKDASGATVTLRVEKVHETGNVGSDVGKTFAATFVAKVRRLE